MRCKYIKLKVYSFKLSIELHEGLGNSRQILFGNNLFFLKRGPERCCVDKNCSYTLVIDIINNTDAWVKLMVSGNEQPALVNPKVTFKVRLKRCVNLTLNS